MTHLLFLMGPRPAKLDEVVEGNVMGGIYESVVVRTDLQFVQQEIGEQKVTKMVAADDYLQSIFRLRVWYERHPGIVDEDIDPPLFGVNFIGAIPH